jgi:hypothetical protein
MDDPYDLNDKADTSFTHGQFSDAAKYYIEAAKKGHSDCIETLYLIDVNWKELDNEVLQDKVVAYCKQEFEKLEKATGQPITLYWEKK